MSIDAQVDSVVICKDGGGQLNLIDRPPSGNRGQKVLHFYVAPKEITKLKGLNIWGGSSQIILGDIMIAKRLSYTIIQFVNEIEFNSALEKYNEKRQNH